MNSGELIAKCGSNCHFGSAFRFPRRSVLLPLLLVLCGFSLAGSLPAQDSPGALNQPLKLMPIPRSVEMGTGRLVIDAHFKAAFADDHDPRLDAALDRMITRLDRQCGDMRRSQYVSGSSGSPVLTLKVAGPGAKVQTVDEDESYQLKITSSQATLTAATDVGAMHGMETLLQLVMVEDGSCSVPVVSIDDAPRFRWRG